LSSQDKSTEDTSIIYKRLLDDEINLLLQDLQNSIADFFRRIELASDVEYTVCGLDLIDVIIRVDKRLHYFKVFHEMDCNEGKKAALFAYWIAKFRPIMITDKRYINTVGFNNEINELFAIHYLLEVLIGMGRIKVWNGHEGIKLSLSNPFIKRLKYSLRFRNFTIDSIIVLADAITTDSFNLDDQSVLP
jgi:hypothetical protein